MMKQDNSTLSLVSTLYIALYILGSINTVSGGQDYGNCYKCGSNGFSCRESVQGSFTCWRNIPRGDPLNCYEEYRKGKIYRRDCVGAGEGRGLHQCLPPDSQGIVKCYCSVASCNDGSLFKKVVDDGKSNNKHDSASAAARLDQCQMSPWLFFAFPLVVTWSLIFAIATSEPNVIIF